MRIDETKQQNGTSPRYRDREEAGERLVEILRPMGLKSPLILAIPRGGLPVAEGIAKGLSADLDLAPAPETATPTEGQEFAMVTADRIREDAGFDPRDRDVVIVDDGIATGASALAAARVLRARGAGRIIVATPVACQAAADRLKAARLETAVLFVSDAYGSLDEFYDVFERIEDRRVENVREDAKRRSATAGAPRRGRARDVVLEIGDELVECRFETPADPQGIVLILDAKLTGVSEQAGFARAIAPSLHQSGLATLTCPPRPLGRAQAAPIVARRAIEWLAQAIETSGLSIGLIGAGPEASLALETAASLPERIRCVAVCAGRIDLADGLLERLQAPTLFVARESADAIAAQDAVDVIESNRAANAAARSESTLALVSDEEMIRVVLAWMERFLANARPYTRTPPESEIGLPEPGTLTP